MAIKIEKEVGNMKPILFNTDQVRWQPYTKEEDKLILNSDDDSRLARQLHRTKCAIQNRRARLKQCIIPNT